MEAALVSGWEALCQLLAPAFTRPTMVTFLHLATGWVLCRSRPTVTNLICTIGSSLLAHAAKHWTVYERFFYRAAWSLPQLSRLLLTRVVVPLIDRRGGGGGEIDLDIDDTTCSRCGKHVAYAGYFKDASVSNTLRTVVHWSHNWVIAAVAMRDKRWPMWVIGLPVLFTLYRKRPDCDKAHPFLTRQQIAAQMIHEARSVLPQRTIRIAADGQYASGEVVKAASEARSNLVSRMRCDAAIYALPPRRKRFKRGRRKKKGKRLPAPRRLAARKKGWRTVEVLAYGKRVKRRVLAVTCLWYHVSKDKPVKLLIVRDPSGKQKDDYLFCTDPAESDEQIIERLAARWPIEQCIHDGKQAGGFEQVQGWCKRTVERQAPLALLVQTLVKAWYLLHGAGAALAQPEGAKVCGWLRQKDHPSYLDMLATLRRVLWTHRIKSNSTFTGRVRQLIEPLRFTLCAAM